MQSRRILLVSSDLMASSRLAGVVRGGGGTLDVQATLASARKATLARGSVDVLGDVAA